MYRLYWEFNGAVRGREFDVWADLERFSRKLIDAGLCPWVAADCPTPYDAG